MRSARTLGVIATVLVTLAACSRSTAGATDLAARAGRIAGCLSGAGLRASVEDTKAFGVDAPHAHVSVRFHSDAFRNEVHAADVWIFESAAAAREARPAITFQSADTQTNEVVGTSLVHFNSVIPAPEDRRRIDSCL